MRKIIISMMISLLLAGSAGSGAMAISVEDARIYKDLRNTCMKEIIDFNPSDVGEHLDSVFDKIAEEYGISLNVLNNIWMNANVEYNFTNSDIAISKDFWGAFNVLPDSATSADRASLLKKVADQYGVTIEKVKDIAFRTM